MHDLQRCFTRMWGSRSNEAPHVEANGSSRTNHFQVIKPRWNTRRPRRRYCDNISLQEVVYCIITGQEKAIKEDGSLSLCKRSLGGNRAEVTSRTVSCSVEKFWQEDVCLHYLPRWHNVRSLFPQGFSHKASQSGLRWEGWRWCGGGKFSMTETACGLLTGSSESCEIYGHTRLSARLQL